MLVRASPLVVKSFGGSIVDLLTKTRGLVGITYAEQDKVVRREQDILGLETFINRDWSKSFLLSKMEPKEENMMW